MNVTKQLYETLMVQEFSKSGENWIFREALNKQKLFFSAFCRMFEWVWRTQMKSNHLGFLVNTLRNSEYFDILSQNIYSPEDIKNLW